MADYGARKNQYFVPGDGIAREVITSDICKYLDNDATVRPYTYEGREGYMIYAYRNLTSAMIEDLRRDTALWEREKDRQGFSRRTDRGGSRGTRYDSGYSGQATSGTHRPSGGNGFSSHQDAMAAYQDSNTHERRSQTGPSQPLQPVNNNVMDLDPRQNPSPHSSNDGYSRPMNAYQNQSPQHVAQYPSNQQMPSHAQAVHATSGMSNPPMYQTQWSGAADPSANYSNEYPAQQINYQPTHPNYHPGQPQQQGYGAGSRDTAMQGYPSQMPPNAGNNFGPNAQAAPGYSSSSKRQRYDEEFDYGAQPDPRSGYAPDARPPGRSSGGAGGNSGYSGDGRGSGPYSGNYQSSGRDRNRRGY